MLSYFSSFNLLFCYFHSIIMSNMFAQRLNQATIKKNSRVCVGLDPRLEFLPGSILKKAQKEYGDTIEAAASAIVKFNKKVIDVVGSHVAAVKPQIAFYEQYGPDGMRAFQETIAYAKRNDLVVIVDAKRGDIDSTAQAYANALLGKTKVFSEEISNYEIDCITVNPFLGEDSIVPFIEASKEYGKGVFILVKTSNPGSSDIQDIKVGDQNVSGMLAKLVNKYAQETLGKDGYSSIGAVVGATFPEEAKRLRKIMPNSVFLVPGVGAQGGAARDLSVFFNKDGLGAVVNSSRGVVFNGWEGDDNFEKVIAANAKKLQEEINRSLDK